MSTVRYIRHYIAAAPTDIIAAYFPDEVESEELEPFDWYRNDPLSPDAPPATQPLDFDFNVPDEPPAEESQPDYYAQAPPDVFDPPQPSLETEEPPEDQDFGFSIAPLPPDVFDPPQPSLEQEETPEDQDYGFATGPLQEDDQGSISLEVAEEPEDENFGFAVDPLSPDFDQTQLSVESFELPEEPEDTTNFGFIDVPVPPDVIPGAGAIVHSWLVKGIGIKTKLAVNSQVDSPLSDTD